MLKKKLSSMILAVMLVTSLSSCTNQNKNDKTVKLHYGFDETQGEEAFESVSKTNQHVKYVFNQENQPMLYQEAQDPQWRSRGVVGGALRFDGYSNYLVQQDFKMPSEAFTISAWVAPFAFEWGDGGNLSAIISQSSFQYQEGIDFGMYRLGQWGVKLGVGGNSIRSTQTYMVTENYYLKPHTWQFIAATFNQDYVYLYYNGQLAGSFSLGDYAGFPLNVAKEQSLYIGKNGAHQKVENFDANMYNGLLDELMIRNTCLSEQAIMDIYQDNLILHDGKIPIIPSEDIELQQSWYASDRNRPQFHAMPNGHWMNEPHAPFYFNGKYHLFYQHNPVGPFWHQIHWGHWVSDDLVHWEDVGVAIRPQLPVTPDGVWSGSASYDADGNPVLFITAGNDSAKPNQAVAIFRPKDLSDPYLKEWVGENQLAISQTSQTGKFGEFRDPFVFQKNGAWYTLVGSGTKNNKGGTALIYKSTNLKDFSYMGELFVSNFEKYNYLGLQWELPVFLPLRDQNGKETNKWFFAISPHPVSLSNVEVFYWIGEFHETTGRFIPDFEEPRMLDYGDGVFTGPSGFVDPVTGRSILFTIAQGIGMNSWGQYYSGWAHSAGMPVELWYNTQTKNLNFQAISEVANLREKTLVSLQTVSFAEANQSLKNVRGDLLEIVLEVDPKESKQFGIQVRQSELEWTTITYQVETQSLIFNSTRSSDKIMGFQRTAVVPLVNGNIQIKILLDRSLIEIYGNQVASITSRIYPTFQASQGVSVMNIDGKAQITKLEIYQMKSIYNHPTQPGYYEK